MNRIYVFLLAVYVLLSFFTSLKILRSVLLTKNQKTVNVIINCLIPLLWFLLIRPVIFQEEKTMTKAERERMISAESGSKLGDEIGSSRDARHGL